MPSIIEACRRVKGPRRTNHHVRFFGLVFSGLAVGVLVPRANRETKEERDADMEETIEQWKRDHRWRN